MQDNMSVRAVSALTLTRMCISWRKCESWKLLAAASCFYSSRKWSSVQDWLVSVCHWDGSVARGAGCVCPPRSLPCAQLALINSITYPSCGSSVHNGPAQQRFPPPSLPPHPSTLPLCCMYLHGLSCTHCSEKMFVFSRTHSLMQDIH